MLHHGYFGWYIVAITFVTFVILIGMGYASFGLFVVPVSEELGLSRAEMNSAMILLSIGAALSAPLVGRLLDRFSIKRILLASVFAVAGCHVALGLSNSIWLSAFILLLPLPIAMQGAGMLSMNVLLARWFTVHRGRAMALGMMGMSGGMLVTPLIGWLIESYGWRHTLFACAGASVAILGPLFLMVRDRPRADEVEVGPAPTPNVQSAVISNDEGPIGVGSILATPAFWTIAVSSSLSLAVSQGITVSLIPLALGSGLTTTQAATLISVIGIGAIGGKLLIVAFGDRLDRVTILAGFNAALGLMAVALLISQSFWGLLTTAFGFGVAGALTPVFYALMADRFGPRSFGTVQGLMLPIITVLGAISIRFAGEIFDRTGGYALMLYTYIAVQISATLLVYSTRLFDRSAILAVR